MYSLHWSQLRLQPTAAPIVLQLTGQRRSLIVSYIRYNGKHTLAATRLKAYSGLPRIGRSRSQIKPPAPDDAFVGVVALTVTNEAVAPQDRG